MLDENKVIEQLSANETEHKAFNRRIDELENAEKNRMNILLTLQKQGNAIESMTQSISKLAENISSLDGRIKNLEMEPADKWKKASWEIIKYVLLAAVGVAVGYFLK